jgi:chitinase
MGRLQARKKPLRTVRKTIFSLLLAGAGAASFISLSAAKPAPKPSAKPVLATRPLWVSAYYANWVQEAGVLTPEKIDYSAISHLIHFHVIPAVDGTIDPVKSITAEQSTAVITAAHAKGSKVLLCVGGGDTETPFRAAIADAVRPKFISTLMEIVTTRGYDGLDIDMEPVEDTDIPNYENFIHELHAQMTAADPKLLLTCAISSQPELFARLSPEFDQINIMTYDQSGTWEGWKTWHNSSLYGGGERRLNATRPFPSVQENVQKYLKAGVPSAKLGMGLAFYGYAWSGADGPDQSIQNVKMEPIEYFTLMDKYDRPERRHWDADAHAPYLSVEGATPADRKFISFDNELLLTQKMEFAKKQKLGGVIIWELGSGYRGNQPDGKKDVLLQTVKRAWLKPDTKVASGSKP